MSETGKDNDPFAAFESDRTVIKPGAGRPARPPGAPAGAAAGGAPRAEPAGKEAPLALDALMTASLNPLVSAASPLLSAAPRIRSMVQHPNPAGLKDALADGVRKFEAQARAEGLPNEQVIAARYIVCTLLDESAASTPWGGSGTWGRHSLLAMFHNETWGGEKVFQLMAKLAENPAGNRDLLELIYAAVCLGFEGRYRVVEGGRAQLEAVRDRLAQILKKERGDVPPALAQNWRGQAVQRRALLSWLPLWVTAAIAGTATVGLYLALSFSLGGLSDPAYGEIQSLRLTPPTPPATLPAAKPRLAQFLAAEIRAGLVAVRDDVDRSVITLRGDRLFDPGSASLSDEREALMRRIAEALTQVPGNVVVTGHTDNQPIRSARFPSNWHLSEERAKAVRGILVSQGVVPARVSAEGRADGEPLVANDSAANRALNRRVEVTLIAKARAGS